MALTSLEKTLVDCWKYLGASKTQVLYMGATLYTPEMQEEMLQFIREHRDASPAMLCEMCSQIWNRNETAVGAN